MAASGQRPNLPALGAVVVAVVCWGLAPVATRSLALSVHPVVILILRSALSLPVFVPLLLYWRGCEGAKKGAADERHPFCVLGGGLSPAAPPAPYIAWPQRPRRPRR